MEDVQRRLPAGRVEVLRAGRWLLRSQRNACATWPLGGTGKQEPPSAGDTRHPAHVRPVTLVLEKTAAVFERDAHERRLWQSALQWLTKTAVEF